VFKYYKGFDPSYMGEEKGANATTSYGVDSNWYANSDATDHVTGELDKLVVKDMYNDHDRIYTTSGSGMHITHIGKSIIHTLYCDLALNHVLHNPQASKNLASVHRIISDNNVFFELHPDSFFLSRIGSRAKLFFKAGLEVVSTHFHAARPLLLLSNKSLALSRFLSLGGTLI
jgi:hypothetical protein